MSESGDIMLFDMDGSLADYEGALRRELSLVYPGRDFSDLWMVEEGDPGVAHAMRLIKAQPGWWEGLAPIEGGFWAYREANAFGFDRHVLTKGPRRLPAAWMEKVRWCQKWLGDGADVHVVSAKHLTYGKVLYDDFPEYMAAWLERRPRGLGIMPVTAYNRDFRHPNVVKWDGKNQDEVRDALRIAKARRPGEPLALPQ